MKHRIILLILAISFIVAKAQKQDTLPVQKIGDRYYLIQEHHEPKDLNRNGQMQFRIFGNAAITFQAAKYDPAENSDLIHFTEVNFKPIFLWKITPKLFVESEVEIETGEGGPDLGLEYVNMVYTINPYITLHAGRFLPKFGMYRGRLGEDYINRFASNPTGFGDGGIGAMNEVGVGAQGGFQIGKGKMSYDLYLVNGPELIIGNDQFEGDESANAGQYNYEAYIDNNNAKAVGGRIGFIPFSNSCLEFAYSFQHSGNVISKGAMKEYKEYVTDSTSNTGTIDYGKVPMLMQGIDVNFYHNIPGIKSTLRLTGEYKYQHTGNTTYITEADADGYAYPYTYKNAASAFYIMAAWRPSLVKNKVVRNFEIAARYSKFYRPEGATWAGAEYEKGILVTKASDVNKMEASLDYWLNWNCVAKLSYEYTHGMEQYNPHALYAQLVFGF